MKLDSITIQGFRSIKGPLTIKLSQISAFIGANNAGKSNILSCIYRVLGRDWVTVNTFDEDDVHNRVTDQDITVDFTFSEPFKYEAFKGFPIDIPRIKFFYTRYLKGEFAGNRRLEKKCLKLDGSDIYKQKSRPKSGQRPEFEPLTTIPQEIQESFPVIYIGIDRSLRSQLPSARNSMLGTLLADINNDFLKDSNVIKIQNRKGEEVEVSRKERFNACIQAAMTALQTPELKALEASIKANVLHQLGFDQAVEDKFDVQFSPFTSLDFYKSLELYVTENNFKINAIELGGGFQNAIVIAIMKAFEERRKAGALFLIEEPEMFLHPQMQRSLYKTMRTIGQTNQVLYITHSPHFVTVPTFDEIRIVKNTEHGTQVVSSTLTATPHLKEKFRKELNPERNELFFARRVLFVEGDTEKLSIPEYAKRLNIDIDSRGCSIVEVSGKRNLMDFVDLALSFEIPAAFVYDVDSSDFAKDKKADEEKYNLQLEDYTKKGVVVFKLDKNYEEELRNEYGDSNYQQYCQAYPGMSKAIRARQFAMDTSIAIPRVIDPIVKWLGT